MSGKYLTHDSWLTRMIERDAYRLAVDETLYVADNYEEIKYIEKIQVHPVFIYAKSAVNDLSAARFLEQRRFNLIDTNVVFEKPIDRSHKPSGNSIIRFASANDEHQVVDIAINSFVYSRFHLDEAIPVGIANLIKGEWVRNFFLGKRGDQMVVAAVKGHIVGFCQLLVLQDRLVIDLIAVDEAYRRKGVAGDMIAFAETQCKGCHYVKVGTQIANIPSIRLYENMGFRFIEAHYVFHFHSSLFER